MPSARLVPRARGRRTPPTASGRSQSAAPSRAEQEKGGRMLWSIIDGLLDGDWWPLFYVLLLVLTLLVVGFLR